MPGADETRYGQNPELLTRQLELFLDDLVELSRREKERTTELEEAVARLRAAQTTFALNFALLVESHDPDTRRHLDNTDRLATGLAERMGFTQDQLVDLRLGFMLHDIGKANVPREIIQKPGPLDEDEWKIMRTHPSAGALMVSGVISDAAIDIVRCHHERWDGKGYPRGLQGHEIPLAARIFSIADVFDALHSHRSYRAMLSPEEALDIIVSERARGFDPEVVDVFLDYIQRRMRTGSDERLQ